MTDIRDLYYDFSEKVAEWVYDNMDIAKPTDMGLDDRSAYKLHVNQNCIAVETTYDRVLQYYGGFEYVDKEFRVEMGDYIFYFAEDSRVQDHIERYYEHLGADLKAEAEFAA